MTNPAPGWHNDPSGSANLRYWDGVRWTDATAPLPGAAAPAFPPPNAPSVFLGAAAPVPVQPAVRQSRDRAQYTRQQTGHSLIKHLIFGIFVLYIPTIYYAISPNHYFHA